MNSVDDLTAVALLAEPVRQRLYRYVRDRREPVGREEAARNAGISVKLAAFHLDRMVEAGLLEVGYRRLTGRVGPGAGRPAKVYSLTQRAFEITLPQTRYALAASMMATALSGDTSDGARRRWSRSPARSARCSARRPGRGPHPGRPAGRGAAAAGAARVRAAAARVRRPRAAQLHLPGAVRVTPRAGLRDERGAGPRAARRRRPARRCGSRAARPRSGSPRPAAASGSSAAEAAGP